MNYYTSQKSVVSQTRLFSVGSQPLQSTGNAIYVTFTSDSSVTDKGFLLSYTENSKCNNARGPRDGRGYSQSWFWIALRISRRVIIIRRTNE